MLYPIITNKNLIYSCIALFILVINLLCVPASAELSVSGTKYMGEISPGETHIHEMTVSTKPGDQDMDILIDVMGFGQGTDMGYIEIPPANDTRQYSARPWISLDTNSFSLKPGGSKTVKATIAIPENESAGSGYAMIYIHSKPVGKSGTGIVTAIAVPVMVTIKGQPVTESGSITSINTVAKPNGKTTIVTTFKNTGNHHYYGATNAVVVTDSTGNNVATVTLDPSVAAIIPGATVKFEAMIESSLTKGAYVVESKVTLPSGSVLDTKEVTIGTPVSGKITDITSPNTLITWGLFALIACGTLAVGFLLGRRKK